MTRNKEHIVIDIIRKLNASGKRPCKKTIQKMVYLIQEAQEDLGFDYTIHFYGPYSSELDYEIQDLSASGFLSIQKEAYGHFLSEGEMEPEMEVGDESKIVDDVVCRFGGESPTWLELLATALFVQRKKGTDYIIPGVEKIKGTKYSRDQIDKAVVQLREANYFS